MSFHTRFGDSVDRRAPRALVHCLSLDLEGDDTKTPQPRTDEATGGFPVGCAAPGDMALALGLGWAAARQDLGADPATTGFRLKGFFARAPALLYPSLEVPLPFCLLSAVILRARLLAPSVL